MHGCRSWHFVPAHRPEYLEKASASAADALVLDLEDGVPAGVKETARATLRKWLAGLPADERDRCYVRVNAEPAEFRKDLALLRRARVGGVVIPKVETAQGLESAMKAVRRAAPGGRGIALIESFQAVSSLNSILEAWPLFGVGLGLEDMFSDIDPLPDEAVELSRHVRLRLVVEARARRLAAIDSVSLDYRSPSRLARRCAEAWRLGFDGMFTIHPGQIGPVNASFSPRSDDIVWAREVARRSSLRDGSGYSKSGGMVISPPKIRKARRILDRSRSAAR